MFNSFSFEKINNFENKGSILEFEYFGEINKRAYSQAVDEYLNPELYKIKSQEDVERVFLRKNKEKEDFADFFATQNDLKDLILKTNYKEIDIKELVSVYNIKSDK